MDIHEIINMSLKVIKQPVVIAAFVGVVLYLNFMIFVEKYNKKPPVKKGKKPVAPPPKNEDDEENEDEEEEEENEE